MNEPYVYICYAHEDRQFALSLRRELGELGVRWEIDTRKVSNGLRGIQPMPLEDPDVVPPPEDLSHLHFRDRYLLARQASVALKPPQNAN